MGLRIFQTVYSLDSSALRNLGSEIAPSMKHQNKLPIDLYKGLSSDFENEIANNIRKILNIPCLNINPA